jgi:uncharacterized membrane protein
LVRHSSLGDVRGYNAKWRPLCGNTLALISENIPTSGQASGFRAWRLLGMTGGTLMKTVFLNFILPIWAVVFVMVAIIMVAAAIKQGLGL